MENSSPRIVVRSQVTLVTAACEQAAKDFNVSLSEVVELFFKFTMHLERNQNPIDFLRLYEDGGLPDPIEYDYELIVNMLNEGWGSERFKGFSKLRYKIMAIHNDSVEDFRNWLKPMLGLEPSAKPKKQTPDYLDPDHPCYSPKLAAAIHAWEACNKTPKASAKSALKKWLKEHAANYGLLNSDGSINESGVDETAKTANWNPLGGAPKTPS